MNLSPFHFIGVFLFEVYFSMVSSIWLGAGVLGDYEVLTNSKSQNKKEEETLHCERYTHITRSLNFFLYYLAKTISGTPQKGEGISRGTINVRGQSNLSSFGAKLLSSLLSKCVFFSPAFVSVLLLKSFLKSTFLIFSFYEQNAIRSET